MSKLSSVVRHGHLRRVLVSASSVAGLSVSAVAGAQTSPPSNPSQAAAGEAVANASKEQIGDIIVTARRVSERLQDIPASVAAVSGDQVSKMSSLDDIQNLVSGVTFKSVGPYVTAGIRGFGNRPVTTGPNSTVGIFQDGVFIPPFLNALDSRIDVARIEVAKGPQSTLYGRSTYAGAINIVTNDPTSRLSGYAEGGLGGSSAHGEFLWHAQGVISGPITDTLSARVFVLREKRDGYTYDPDTNFRGDGYNRTVGRVKILWEPNDKLKIRLAGTLMHDNSTQGLVQSGKIVPPLGGMSSFGDPFAPSTFVRGPDIWRGSFALQPIGKRNGQEGTLDIRYQTPVGELALLSDYTHSDTNERSQGGTTIADNANLLNITDETRFSQEVRLSDKTGRLTYLLGLYYLYTDFKNGRPGATVDLGAPTLVVGPGTLLYDLAGVQAIYTPGTLKTNAYAAFAQVGYDLTDKLNLTLGIRQARDKLDGTASNSLLLTSGFLLTTLPTTPQRAKFDATTGTANLSYKFTPDVLAYASYSRGDSPGGFNPSAAAAVKYGPQKVNAFEVGLKAVFLDHHLRVNAALFDNEYRSLQFYQEIIFPDGTPVTVTQNAGSARGRGVDLDVLAVLNRDFRLGLLYTYQVSKITSYNIPAPPAPQVSYDGQPLLRSPKHSANGSVTYSHDVGPGKFSFTAEESYTSSYVNDFTGVPAGTPYPGRPGVPPGVTTTQVLGLFKSAGYALTNLNASYAIGKYEISGYVRNLFNHQYIVNVVGNDPMSYALETPGEPRTFMVSLKVSL